MAAHRETRRTPWPDRTGRGPARDQASVGIVVVNSNTRRLIAELVSSLYRLLGADEFAQLVVVDNASTDGSREFLNALHRAGLLHLIRNRSRALPRPGPHAGHLPARAPPARWRPGERLDYVWVLDSDVIVLRPDTVRDALAVFQRSGAALVGQKAGDPAYDRLLRRNREMLHP